MSCVLVVAQGFKAYVNAVKDYSKGKVGKRIAATDGDAISAAFLEIASTMTVAVTEGAA